MVEGEPADPGAVGVHGVDLGVAVRSAGECDPAVAAFAPNQWRLDHGQMVLLSAKGDAWQFEADDNAQWRRVPDSADPLIMLRQ